MNWQNEILIKTLKNNGVVVMPTDTIYGIVGIALNQKVVERIYEIRKRAPAKPCIILIGDILDLEKFFIQISDKQKNIIESYTEPTSFILDCHSEPLNYLHRGTKTLAFRIPQNLELQNLLKQTGPLIAPSANPEGMSYAKNIVKAKNYFHELVDLYVDGGDIQGKASKVIKLHKDGSIHILRE